MRSTRAARADVPLCAISQLLLLALLTAVNLISIRSCGEFEYWFALIKVIAIVMFLAVDEPPGLGHRAARVRRRPGAALRTDAPDTADVAGE
ncbi:hypothetical protein OG609_05885 [Streptomyces sp. NBC_01224]|uniref:hypothetical protein n=1 Tax=Streptomyces sp. NBC_01224 TaxID=2903783 RepID=UPI002E13084B|nr:hypothetical protein OG609_05885 [Streptomyces sp. NBC_01224]